MQSIKVKKTQYGTFRFFASQGTKCVICNKETKNVCFDCRKPLCSDCEDKNNHKCEE